MYEGFRELASVSQRAGVVLTHEWDAESIRNGSTLLRGQRLLKRLFSKLYVAPQCRRGADIEPVSSVVMRRDDSAKEGESRGVVSTSEVNQRNEFLSVDSKVGVAGMQMRFGKLQSAVRVIGLEREPRVAEFAWVLFGTLFALPSAGFLTASLQEVTQPQVFPLQAQNVVAQLPARSEQARSRL